MTFFNIYQINSSADSLFRRFSCFAFFRHCNLFLLFFSQSTANWYMPQSCFFCKLAPTKITLNFLNFLRLTKASKLLSDFDYLESTSDCFSFVYALLLLRREIFYPRKYRLLWDVCWFIQNLGICLGLFSLRYFSKASIASLKLAPTTLLLMFGDQKCWYPSFTIFTSIV